MTNNRQHLRAQIKIKLQNISTQSRIESSKRIAQKIIQHKLFTHSQNIACYTPIGNEIDTKTIIETIQLQDKNCYLPIFSSLKETGLSFVKTTSSQQTISPQDLELVIVPLYGFNSDLHRLGRGGGSYDRTFCFKKDAGTLTKPYLLGIGYTWQQIDFTPSSWDVAMDEVITEKGKGSDPL